MSERDDLAEQAFHVPPPVALPREIAWPGEADLDGGHEPSHARTEGENRG